MKRGKKKLKKQSKYLPAMLVPPPPVVSESDIADVIEIICPMCNVHWANAHIEFGQKMKKKDFSTKDGLDFAFQKNGLPICPLCHYAYTPQAVYAAILATTNKRRMEGSLWTGSQYRSREKRDSSITSSEKETRQE